MIQICTFLIPEINTNLFVFLCSDLIISFLGRVLMNFIKLYVRFGNEELVAKFEDEINIITNKTKQTMGIEEFVLERAKRIGKAEGKLEGKLEGKQEGKLEGKLEGSFNFVTSLLQNSDFDDAKIAFIASVSLDFVKKVKDGTPLSELLK